MCLPLKITTQSTAKYSKLVAKRKQARLSSSVDTLRKSSHVFIVTSVVQTSYNCFHWKPLSICMGNSNFFLRPCGLWCRSCEQEGILYVLTKQLSYSRGSYANKHFIKFWTRAEKERNIGFTSDGLGQQSLSSSRWTNQQYSYGGSHDIMWCNRNHMVPRGNLAPSFWNFSGFLRNSTTSYSSSLASSTLQ